MVPYRWKEYAGHAAWWPHHAFLLGLLFPFGSLDLIVAALAASYTNHELFVRCDFGGGCAPGSSSKVFQVFPVQKWLARESMSQCLRRKLMRKCRNDPSIAQNIPRRMSRRRSPPRWRQGPASPSTMRPNSTARHRPRRRNSSC